MLREVSGTLPEGSPLKNRSEITSTFSLFLTCFLSVRYSLLKGGEETDGEVISEPFLTPNNQLEPALHIGILSDTHDQLDRTKVAIERLRSRGAEAIVHCGDLTSPDIVEVCSVLPFYFVFGNHDSGTAHVLEEAATQFGANCLEWGGEIQLAGKRVAAAHGHIPKGSRSLIAAKPDYFLFGHSHQRHDSTDGELRRINPGALYRATEFTVALLDLQTDVLEFITIERRRRRRGAAT